MSGMEWHEMDVKDHRHNVIYSLAGVKNLNVIQEVRLKAICRIKLCDDSLKRSENSGDLTEEINIAVN